MSGEGYLSAAILAVIGLSYASYLAWFAVSALRFMAGETLEDDPQASRGDDGSNHQRQAGRRVDE